MVEMLKCSDVQKSYGGVSVLRGVNLTVSEGEILGLIGANGAGKSTLIDIISGLTPQTSGEILIGGRSLSRVSPDRRAMLGLARSFQHPQVAMDLTLRENIVAACAAKELSSIGSSLRHFFSAVLSELLTWYMGLMRSVRN